MMRIQPWLALVVAVSAALPARLDSGAEVDESVHAVEARYTAAWRTNDRAAMAKLRAQAEELPESARSLYLLALMEQNTVVRVNGSPNTSDPERTLEALAFAADLFAASHELDPSNADPCVAAAFGILHRMTIGFGTTEDQQDLRRWATRAVQAEADHPSTRLLSTWLSAGPSASSREGAAAMNERFFDLGVSVVEAVRAEERAPTFWELFTEMASVRALLFSPIPRPDMGAELTAMILEQSPDYHAALRFLAPFVAERDPLPLTAFDDVAWTNVPIDSDDELADGQSANLADATSLSVARDDESSTLYFRIGLAEAPDDGVFGVNVVLDADGSQENGSPWWGGTSGFRFDRLVSAWIARGEDGAWRGAVGVTDDQGAFEGEMTNLLDGGVRFAFDVPGKAVLVRVPAGALGASGDARYLIAVGSNAQWNDNLPDSQGLPLPATE